MLEAATLRRRPRSSGFARLGPAMLLQDELIEARLCTGRVERTRQPPQAGKVGRLEDGCKGGQGAQPSDQGRMEGYSIGMKKRGHVNSMRPKTWRKGPCKGIQESKARGSRWAGCWAGSHMSGG